MGLEKWEPVAPWSEEWCDLKTFPELRVYFKKKVSISTRVHRTTHVTDPTLWRCARPKRQPRNICICSRDKGSRQGSQSRMNIHAHLSGRISASDIAATTVMRFVHQTTRGQHRLRLLTTCTQNVGEKQPPNCTQRVTLFDLKCGFHHFHVHDCRWPS